MPAHSRDPYYYHSGHFPSRRRQLFVHSSRRTFSAAPDPSFEPQDAIRLPRVSNHLPLQAAKRNDEETYSFSDISQLDLPALEWEITKLNHGTTINFNSPKQVSMAIFGRVQSANREILLKASQGESDVPLDEQQQRLAAMILECRDRSRNNNHHDDMNKQESQQSSNTAGKKISQTKEEMQMIVEEDFSEMDQMTEISAEEIVTSQNNNVDDQTHNPNDVSQFEKLVDALFDHEENLIPEYWREPLKQVTRPSARALVAQLDPTICPMGYNPLAVPHDPLRGTTTNSDTAATTSTAGKKGSFLGFCREMKSKHKDCVLVTRCGDFYECFGVDAIMLVEHCGLNAMAGKAKAGFPFRSIQASLDCLTQKGFRVAVYEEAVDTDASSGASKAGKSRLKTRMLAQVISPASPTYLYDLVLLGNTADTLASAIPARPYMGIMSLRAGYTLVEISIEERSVRVSERMTAESAACRLAAYPPASPLLLVPSPSEYQSHSKDYARMAPFLPSVAKDDAGSRLTVKIIPPTLVQDPKAGISDIERARQTIVSALLQMTELEEADPEFDDSVSSRRRATIDDFTLIATALEGTDSSEKLIADVGLKKTQTFPLHLETATQLGLMNDKAIPSLMSCLLPDSAPAATRRFLRRYLLNVPPPTVCEAMATLVGFLKQDENSPSLPPLAVPPLGKVLSLLRAGQASAHVYGELLQAMAATTLILDLERQSSLQSENFREPLMTILEHESGMSAEPNSLRNRCLDAMHKIESVISVLHHAPFNNNRNKQHQRDKISDFGDLIPSGFLERNEAMWRGRVQPAVAGDSYGKVQSAAENLARAVAQDFFGIPYEELRDEKRQTELKNMKNPIVQDIFNNLFAIKEIPKWASDRALYIHPRDRNGKLLKNRYTTEAVQAALSDYVAACDEACKDVASILTNLSQELYDEGHIPAIVQAAHANLILSTAFHHAQKANSLGWNLAEVYEAEDPNEEHRNSAGHFEGVWPYWMDRSEAVPNSFEMKDLFLLTAPNMSGKSTLMRSTSSAALLAVCGLCAPLEVGSKIRRFDHIFVRGASADIPAEHKSAFGAEMGDVASLLRCCGPKSLVFVDELGRGTSPKDGTRLAGAVLEAMAKAGMSGIFATHLHDILQLPLESSERIVKKQMAIHDEDLPEYSGGGDGGTDNVSEDYSSSLGRHHYHWTYRLADGVCTDSMALVTAAQFGLPDEVLARAEAFASFLPDFGTAGKQQIPSQDMFALNGAALLSQKAAGSHDAALNGEKMNGEGSTRNGGMDKVMQIVKDTCGETPLSVPPHWNPPASLEGQSCVYILRLDFDDDNDDDGKNPSSSYYYVGETDAFAQRLKQHRKKGGVWAGVDAIAVPLPGGKSESRVAESILIQKLAKAGFPLQSSHDGRTLRSSRRQSM